VVFLRIPESVIEYAAEQLPRGGDEARIEAVQNRIRRFLDRRGGDRSIMLDLPDLPIEPGTLHDVDAFFDACVKLAFEAAQWLHKHHRGPSLEDAPGLLAELWRDAGRCSAPPAES
jgi:hypothetical protein